MLREAVQKLYPSQALPDVPPPAKTASYGSVVLKQGPSVLEVAAPLSNGGLEVDVPENMEQYNQSCVAIVAIVEIIIPRKYTFRNSARFLCQCSISV